MRRTAAPFALLAFVMVVSLIATVIAGRTVDSSTGYATMQYFATIAPVALGFGLGVLAGQFDLSVGAMFGFAGVVAILTGGDSWILGIACACGAGAVTGLIQGTLVSRLRLPSLPVTLGGLVTLTGLGYVVTGSRDVSFSNYVIGTDLSRPIVQILSVQSLLALGYFAVAFAVLRWTRVGRDVYAVGGNPQASRRLGLPVVGVLTGVMIATSVLSSLAGATVAYTLSAASPQNASNPLIPAAIAAVIGGLAIIGGRGSVAGVLAGALTLSVVNTAFNVLAAPAYISGIVYGVLLIATMVLASSERREAWEGLRRRIGSDGSTGASPWSRHGA